MKTTITPMGTAYDLTFSSEDDKAEVYAITGAVPPLLRPRADFPAHNRFAVWPGCIADKEGLELIYLNGQYRFQPGGRGQNKSARIGAVFMSWHEPDAHRRTNGATANLQRDPGR